MELVIKIAAGVLLAVVILFAANQVYLNYQAHQLAKALEEMTENQQARAAAQRQAAFDKKVKEARLTIIREDRKSAKEKLDAKKERAWNEFYQQPEDCLSFRSEEHMIECGNKRIRARKAFDREWTGRKAP